MPKTATAHHPKDLAHGDRVTIEDAQGNQLNGLLRRVVSDNQLEITLTMKAFGKEIRVASWEAGRRKWTSTYPVTNRQATLW